MQDTILAEYAKRVQNGDRESFRLLVNSLSSSLLAMAYRYTLDWDSAGDITQDTWVKVYGGIRRYDVRQSFRPWLFTIHRNNCMSYVRAEGKRKKHEMNYTIFAHERENSLQSNPLDDAAGAEFGARLRAAMKYLTNSQRKVVSLIDIEQMDQKEASLMLNMSHATLRTTLHFARKRLAAILLKDGR